MPNPPTQGRERIERAAKALQNLIASESKGEPSWEHLSNDEREGWLEQAQAVLDAAYPQQTPTVDYDAEADAFYVTLKKGKQARTVEVNTDLLIDVDADGQTLGVEVLTTKPYPQQTEEVSAADRHDAAVYDHYVKPSQQTPYEEADKLARECERLQGQLESERGQAEAVEQEWKRAWQMRLDELQALQRDLDRAKIAAAIERNFHHWWRQRCGEANFERDEAEAYLTYLIELGHPH